MDDKAEYLYHATLDKNLSGIRRLGLIPSEDPNWGGQLGQDSYGKVFLGSSPEQAIYYGEITQEASGYECEDIKGGLCRCYPEMLLLRIKRTAVPDAKLDTGSDKDYLVEHSIDPKDIEYLKGEHCWKSLGQEKEDVIEEISSGEWRETATPPEFWEIQAETKRILELCDCK